MSNPFEVRQNKGRHQSALNERLRGEKKNLQRSRADQEFTVCLIYLLNTFQRKKNILGELKQVGRTNSFSDKRIGEKEADLTDAQKAAKRFQHLRMKKAKKSFNLDGDDSIVFTHGGRTLSDIHDKELMLDGVSDDEDLQNQMQNEIDNIDMNAPENHQKSRKEIYAEIIAKHKMRKAEKFKEKLDQEDRVVSLDEKYGSLLSMIKLRPTRSSVEGMIQREAERQHMDDFDLMAKSFTFERRLAAQDRLKTPEELAELRAKELEVLEKKRKRREKGLDSDEEEDGGLVENSNDEKESDDEEEEDSDDGPAAKRQKSIPGFGGASSDEDDETDEDDEDDSDVDEDDEENDDDMEDGSEIESSNEDDPENNNSDEDEEESEDKEISDESEDEEAAAARIASEALNSSDEEDKEEESEVESSNEGSIDDEEEDDEKSILDNEVSVDMVEEDENNLSYGVLLSSDDEIAEDETEEQRKKRELDEFANEGRLAANDDPMQNGEGEEDLPFVYPFPKTPSDVCLLLWGEEVQNEPKRAWKVFHRIRAKYDTEMRLEGGKKGMLFGMNLVLALVACMSGVMAPDALSGRRMVGAIQEHVLEVFQKYPHAVLATLSALIRRVAVRIFPSDTEDLIDARWRLKGRNAEDDKLVLDYEIVAAKSIEALTLGGAGIGELPGFLMPLEDASFASISIDDISVLHVASLLLPVTDERHPLATPCGILLDVVATRLANSTLLPLHVPVSAKKLTSGNSTSQLPTGREWPSDAPDTDEVALRTVAALRTFTNASRRYSPGLFMLLAKLLTSLCTRLARSASSVTEQEAAATAKTLKAVCNSTGLALRDLSTGSGDEAPAIAPESAHVVCEHMIIPSCIDARRRLLHTKSDRTYPEVVLAIVGLEASATANVRGRKVPLTLYQSRVMGIKQLDPAILDIDNSSAARRLGQKGDPNKSEHRKLKNELNQTRRSTARALRRDAEFVAAVSERERQKVDKKRQDNYKKMVATLDSEHAELKKMETAGGHMDTSLGSHRAKRDLNKRGRVAGNKTDENRRDGDKRRAAHRETVKKNSRR